MPSFRFSCTICQLHHHLTHAFKRDVGGGPASDCSGLSVATAKLAEPGFLGPARTAVGPRRMPRIALPCPADGDSTRANQREALAGALPLERRDQLAARLTDQD